MSWVAHGVSIDTRSLKAGDLFVALKDTRDGHDFVAQALEKGAAAALVSRIPEGLGENDPLLVVDDVLRALEDLARLARRRTQAKVVAVTGSAGKTSTKDMLQLILGAQGRVHAAEKSYNNHWGVPLTLARLPEDAQFAVIEIGMNHPGEIAPLARLSYPDVAIVTTVAAAHLEAFADVEAIAAEKASIFQGLSAQGLAVVNHDVATAPLLYAAAPAGRVESFGQAAGADWQLLEYQETNGTSVCKARYDGQVFLFKLGVPGRHFAQNGLAALAASHAVGADLAQAMLALARWKPALGRGRRRFICLDAALPERGITLLDEAYNSNPASLAAALEVLALTQPTAPGGRRVAVLGDMKELGAQAAQLHRDIAKHTAIPAIDVFHCVGPLMEHFYQALPEEKRGFHVQSSAELTGKPLRLAHAGDVLMAKGSLSMKMAAIVDAIAKLGQGSTDQRAKVRGLE